MISWAYLDVQHDLKQSQKEYDKNKERDEFNKLFAVGGHWVDHKGVSHYDPKLAEYNMTPERIALREQSIKESKEKLAELQRKAKAKGW